MSIDISTLHNLSVSDKLQIVTDLSKDIASSPQPILVPPDVLREAERRSDELRADPSITIDDEEFWRRVDGC